MRPGILMLLYFLGAAHGAAYPEPTPAAILEKRDPTGLLNVATVWSPFAIGATTLYEAVTNLVRSDASISIQGNDWNWCAVTSSSCFMATACESGTVYYPGGSSLCGLYTLCTTGYLFYTFGAATSYTRPGCGLVAPLSVNLYLVSPGADPNAIMAISTPGNNAQGASASANNSPLSSSSPYSSSSSSPSSSSSSSSSTPAGAIAGGVVGGLVVIGGVTIILVLLLRGRRALQPPPISAEAPPPGAAAGEASKPAAPAAPAGTAELENTYDAKRASAYASSVPVSAASSPPPAAQGLPGPFPPGAAYYPPQQYGVPAATYAEMPPGATAEMPSVSAVGMPPVGTVEMPSVNVVELPVYGAPMPGAVEMGANEPRG